jgi:small subunit ribosomal protein S13
MARLLGVDIPNEKRIEASLPTSSASGRPWRSEFSVRQTSTLTPGRGMSNEQISAIVSVIQANAIAIEGDLRRDIQLNLKRLQQINCYRAFVTARVCPCADSAPRPIPAPARDRAAPLACRSPRADHLIVSDSNHHG